MTISYSKIKERQLQTIRSYYTGRDTMLYALSLGLGNDPLDVSLLPYVFEGTSRGLCTLPTQAVVLGYPGFWARDPDVGIDWLRLVHGEQRMRVHRPLPSEATVVGHNRVTHLTDKGEGKGAIMVTERRLESIDGELLATLQQVSFLRGDGGFSTVGAGQPSDPPLPALSSVPEDREPDIVDVQAIRPEAALLYRLMGDPNPLHADPVVATAAGFGRPILHGLATYGMVAAALLRHCADFDGSRLRGLDVRFAAPVFPGETLVTEIWKDESEPLEFRLRARVLERDKIVLSHGWAELV
ncbi:MaoC/PaaZ C-terminal domain-containing protein [Cupriavidus sp. 2SB]|uniref:MaoC/PaaZ C-terminal domain-containing protein n=1 Tax=Cupriavidus sp. 2SB TaxID=2502199 RepID=UPI0010F6585E|nr:MaoC/PaaZ C-terminal domain-containing protein [Cupriavidus sp. 2SB]